MHAVQKSKMSLAYGAINFSVNEWRAFAPISQLPATASA